MKIVKVLAGVLLALIAIVAIAFVAARFNDGPLGIIPGGPLVAGEVDSTPVDSWDAERDLESIEMQLDGDSTSRTTWFVVHDGKGYIPASLGFPPGKTWHLRADGSSATIRVRGKRYPVVLTKLENESIQAALEGIVNVKYGGGPPSDAGVWFFNTASKPSAPM